MMSKTRLYPEEQTHAVAYHDENDGESYEGTLSFGGGRWVRLNFKNNAPASLVEGQGDSSISFSEQHTKMYKDLRQAPDSN